MKPVFNLPDSTFPPRSVVIDIENSPELGYGWGTREVDMIGVKEHSFILSYSYQWLGEKTIHTVALPDFPTYKKDKHDDYRLVDSIWKVLEKADIVIGQNVDAFDIKKMNSRFAFHRMTPPSPYKTVDTLKKLRQSFGLPSNRLDDACRYFGIGRKLPHTGKDLWFGCMEGDKKSWILMKKYNAHDVYLTHELYKFLLPWGKQVDQNIYSDRPVCSACGGKHVVKRGRDISYGRVFDRFSCLDCGKYMRDFGEKREDTKIRLRQI